MKKGQGENSKGRPKPKEEVRAKKELERVAQTKSGQALALDILKMTSMGQSEERMCEETENPEPKKFELRDWNFPKEDKVCHK